MDWTPQMVRVEWTDALRELRDTIVESYRRSGDATPRAILRTRSRGDIVLPMVFFDDTVRECFLSLVYTGLIAEDIEVILQAHQVRYLEFSSEEEAEARRLRGGVFEDEGTPAWVFMEERPGVQYVLLCPIKPFWNPARITLEEYDHEASETAGIGPLCNLFGRAGELSRRRAEGHFREGFGGRNW